MRTRTASIVLLALGLTSAMGIGIASAQNTSSFTDLKSGSAVSGAVEYLKSKGILSGYADGTFRPSNKVNRAEALKFIVSISAKPSDVSAVTTTGYTDVSPSDWFAPYVERARLVLHCISGPPKTSTFAPTRPVQKIEFLKMLFLSQGIDPGSYGEITSPLGNDAQDPGGWFYPYARYGIASSVIQIEPSGSLGLTEELTRGDVASIIYRFLMYRDGRRTQALLTEEETELVNVLQMLQQKNLGQAQAAAARALLASRGAKDSRPDATIVSGAVRIAQSFTTLVDAYAAGSQGKYDDAITFSKNAWKMAEEAKQFSAQLSSVTGQVQQLAKTIADEARKAKGAK